jgi:hypothetical protein
VKAGSGPAGPLLDELADAARHVLERTYPRIDDDAVARIKAGQKVTINVPTARIAGVTGRVQQLIPTPVSTAQGLFYQAVITVTGRVANAPMNGMAASIQLG